MTQMWHKLNVHTSYYSNQLFRRNWSFAVAFLSVYAVVTASFIYGLVNTGNELHGCHSYSNLLEEMVHTWAYPMPEINN